MALPLLLLLFIFLRATTVPTAITRKAPFDSAKCSKARTGLVEDYEEPALHDTPAPSLSCEGIRRFFHCFMDVAEPERPITTHICDVRESHDGDDDEDFYED